MLSHPSDVEKHCKAGNRLGNQGCGSRVADFPEGSDTLKGVREGTGNSEGLALVGLQGASAGGDVGNWGVPWAPTLSESPLTSLLGVLLENLLVGLQCQGDTPSAPLPSSESGCQ